MIYFGIFEIFKYTFASNFYYGTLGETHNSTKLFLSFAGSLIIVVYIYTISLMNIRISKSELDQMQKILEQPQYHHMKTIKESIQDEEHSLDFKKS